MIPTWLQRHLEEAGRWNVDGIGRHLSAGRCARCRQQVLRGLDDDVAGLPVVCDPGPVDELGEFLALAAGRPTYTLSRRGGRWLIDPRDRYRIAARRQDVVLAAHACGSAPLPAAPTRTPQGAVTTPQEPTW